MQQDRQKVLFFAYICFSAIGPQTYKYAVLVTVGTIGSKKLKPAILHTNEKQAVFSLRKKWTFCYVNGFRLRQFRPLEKIRNLRLKLGGESDMMKATPNASLHELLFFLQGKKN